MPELSHTIAFRAVEGAVRNALHGHPTWKVPAAFAKSVAKRAAGTLMVHAGPSLLASARRSGKRRTLPKEVTSGARSLQLMISLSRAHRFVTFLVAAAHKDGDAARFTDLVTAARILKIELKRLKQVAESETND